MTVMDLTICPECGHLAEVERRDVLESTDGPVEHARVACFQGHRFFLPVEWLARTRVRALTAPQVPPEARDAS